MKSDVSDTAAQLDGEAPTSAEGAHVVHVLPAHAALPLLLEGLLLEDVGFPLNTLHTQKGEKLAFYQNGPQP